MDENRRAAAEEHRGRRNRFDRGILMLIISAALQWVLILVCIVLLTRRGQEELTSKLYAIAELQDPTKCEKAQLVLKEGFMAVENGSIRINVTGLYLLYVQGLVRDNSKKGNIKLYFRYRDSISKEWIVENVQKDSISATMVGKLYRRSEIYLNTCGLALDSLNITVYHLPV